MIASFELAKTFIKDLQLSNVLIFPEEHTQDTCIISPEIGKFIGLETNTDVLQRVNNLSNIYNILRNYKTILCNLSRISMYDNKDIILHFTHIDDIEIKSHNDLNTVDVLFKSALNQFINILPFYKGSDSSNGEHYRRHIYYKSNGKFISKTITNIDNDNMLMKLDKELRKYLQSLFNHLLYYTLTIIIGVDNYNILIETPALLITITIRDINDKTLNIIYKILYYLNRLTTTLIYSVFEEHFDININKQITKIEYNLNEEPLMQCTYETSEILNFLDKYTSIITKGDDQIVKFIKNDLLSKYKKFYTFWDFWDIMYDFCLALTKEFLIVDNLSTEEQINNAINNIINNIIVNNV